VFKVLGCFGVLILVVSAVFIFGQFQDEGLRKHAIEQLSAKYEGEELQIRLLIAHDDHNHATCHATPGTSAER